MKYLEILQFNPIVDVIQFNRLSERDYQLDALHNFVYPDYFLETILPEFVKNMVFGGHDQKGIQVIGSYPGVQVEAHSAHARPKGYSSNR